jgi:chromosome partitioning protein
MKIVFGNQKGGSGKSTLCILLANYLSLKKQRLVLILDLDLQGTIQDKRTRDSHLVEKFPYAVIKMSIAEYIQNLEKFQEMLMTTPLETYVLMDLPGNLENPDLKYVLKEADKIVCPFEYEFGSYVSTLDFRDLCENVVPQKQLHFVPNKVQGTVKYATQSQIETELSQSGTITQALPYRIGLQRINTYQMSEEESSFIEGVWETLNM